MPSLKRLAGKPRTLYRRTVVLCAGECGEYKPRDQFYTNKRTATGVTPYCKECYKLYYINHKGKQA